MNNRGVPDGTYLKSFSSENTTIIHYSSATRLHYSSFIKVLLQNATALFCSDSLVKHRFPGDAVLYAGFQGLGELPVGQLIQVGEPGVAGGGGVDLGDIGLVTHGEHLAVDGAAADDEGTGLYRAFSGIWYC